MSDAAHDHNAHSRPATPADVRWAIRFLVRELQIPLPVRVRVDIPQGHDDFGSCVLVEEPTRHFRIRLQKGMCVALMHYVLCHEVAHCLDWRPDAPFRTDHGATFGIHWSEVYCCFYGVS